jgi:hypothetical protein
MKNHCRNLSKKEPSLFRVIFGGGIFASIYGTLRDWFFCEFHEIRKVFILIFSIFLFLAGIFFDNL